MTHDARPLLDLLEYRRPQLEAVASAWLQQGAKAVMLYERDEQVMVWSEAATAVAVTLKAAISANGQVIGQIGVCGPTDDAAAARLTADAGVLSLLAGLEDELNSMTRELIGSQDQLLALYDLTESTRSRLDIDAVLYSLAHESARLFKCEGACAFLMERPPVIIHDDWVFLNETTVYDCFQQLQQTGSHLVINAPDAAQILPDGMTAALIEPIRIHGEIAAGLCLVNRSGSFHSPDLKLARAICDQAGAQLENVLLYQETLAQARLQTEMELAKEVQLHLLPQRLPQTMGLDIAAGSLPALQVGGDFYDFIQRPGEAFIFTIGDVTGKGMPAALLMAMTRTVLRSKSRSLAEPTPASILGSANDDMYDDFTEVGMFATVFVGQYERHDHVLYYANAGHSPVIYCPLGGTAQLLEADGTAMGVMPVSLCENQGIPLNSGDVLVAATDGFSEAGSQRGELFGYERLLALVEVLAEQSAASIASGLFSAIAEFSAGHAQDDDQTLIVIKGV